MLQQQFCTDPIAHFKGKVFSENIEFHCSELGPLYTGKMYALVQLTYFYLFFLLSFP